MGSSPLNVLSLCAGIGGIDLGVRIAVPDARTVCLVEREIAACRILATRMEEGSLDSAPVWLDLGSFDGRPWRGLVDLVIAGLPCQPFSVAGKQRGNSDERAWGDGDGPVPNALRIIAECQPSLVFFENVSTWVTGGHFRSVGEELSRLGYTVEDALFIRAEDVGASHRRERVFILAHSIVCQADDDSDGRQRSQLCLSGWESQQAISDADGSGVRDVELANAGRERVSGRTRLHAGGMGGKASEVESRSEDAQRQRLRDAAGDGGEPVRSGIPGVGQADTCGTRREIRSGERANDESQRSPAERNCGSVPGVGQADTWEQRCGQPRSAQKQAGNDGTAASECSSEPVGDANVPRTHARSKGCSSRGTTGESGQFVGNASRQLYDWSGEAEGGLGDQYSDPIRPVGDTTNGQPCGLPIRAGEFLSRSGIASGDLPIFPPGPGAREDWNAILKQHPFLAPAINQEEVESFLRELVAGDAASLDYSRIDSLRGLGNLCVPLQAAVAFTILARKAGVMP